MSDEQLYLFDLKGWLILPGLLHAAQIEEVKAHLYAGGGALEGPAAELLDHPAVAAVLNELLADRDLSDAHHNFRCEGGFTTIRQPGWQPTGTAVPHVVRPRHLEARSIAGSPSHFDAATARRRTTIVINYICNL